MTRRNNLRRIQSLEEFSAWAEANIQRTEAKYGMGQNVKRDSGLNLCVHNTLAPSMIC